jgi:ADP-ribose pyrophosphatase YjhB (NUDIX family)
MNIERTRVTAVIIRNKKILLVKGDKGYAKDFFFTPGGKIEEGEGEEEALKRELVEELSLASNSSEKIFEYIADGWNGGQQKVICFLVKINVEDINLSSEVTEMFWYGKENFEKDEPKISESMAKLLMPKLIELEMI